jgi:aryl carrier-like protein
MPADQDGLREIVAAIIGAEPDAIAEDADLGELGLDSLRAIQLVERLRGMGLRVSFRELAAEPTLAALRRRLDAPRPDRTPPGQATGGSDHRRESVAW